MNKLSAVIISIVIMLAFSFSSLGETLYAHSHEDCACCAANQCHSKTKCHDTAKACVCNYHPTQVSLPQSTTLPVLAFSGYLNDNLEFTYRYVSTKDIFHPPKLA